MSALFPYCLSILYLTYIGPVALLYSIFLPFFWGGFLLLRKGQIDDAFRASNRLFGLYLVRASWPFLRVRRRGLENLLPDRPCVLLFNHRSMVDIFFAGMIPIANLSVAIRAWPFRIWVFNWFMRVGRYLDVERLPFDVILQQGKVCVRRGVSFLFFPEGHRSRDGRLQRFHSGAFRFAVECGLPVVPVCLTGSERFCQPHALLFRPALVTVDILPPIDPGDLPNEQRALKLQRLVESIYRERLGE